MTDDPRAICLCGHRRDEHEPYVVVKGCGVGAHDPYRSMCECKGFTPKSPGIMCRPTDPVHERDGAWFFWDEVWTTEHGPYASETEAREQCCHYAREVLEGEVRCPTCRQMVMLAKRTNRPIWHGAYDPSASNLMSRCNGLDEWEPRWCSTESHPRGARD